MVTRRLGVWEAHGNAGAKGSRKGARASTWLMQDLTGGLLLTLNILLVAPPDD